MNPGPDIYGVDGALVESIATRAAEARERIARAGADPELVRIVAVTKGFGPERVVAAFAAGLADFGENYADELISKWETVGHDARWHFLGAVQRNKVGKLSPVVDCWQAVARVVEGEAIMRHRGGSRTGPRASTPSPPRDRPMRRQFWSRSTRPVSTAGAAARPRRCPRRVRP